MEALGSGELALELLASTKVVRQFAEGSGGVLGEQALLPDLLPGLGNVVVIVLSPDFPEITIRKHKLIMTLDQLKKTQRSIFGKSHLTSNPRLKWSSSWKMI